MTKKKIQADPKPANGQPKAITRKLRDLIPDTQNANLGTIRGLALLDDSLREDGAGRGILLDKAGNVIAGNKTLERAVDLGFEEVIVVPTDGKQLVATQRTDVELDSQQGRRMAIRDNRVGEADLDWSAEVLHALQEKVDLTQFFNDNELVRIFDPQIDPDDPVSHWEGMPEFTQNEVKAYQTIIIHFANAEAVADFARIIGQVIGEKTKFIWYPKRTIEHYGVVHES